MTFRMGIPGALIGRQIPVILLHYIAKQNMLRLASDEKLLVVICHDLAN